MSKENLKFWESVEKTDPKYTKGANIGGRKITTINAQYQKKNATEKWGKYGEKWGLRNIETEYIHGLDHEQVLSITKAIFYYPNGEFEIGTSRLVQAWFSSKSYLKIDEDFIKKSHTDMITKALSNLGFNSDVFLTYFDDISYVNSMKQEFKEKDILNEKHAKWNACVKAIETKTYTIEDLKANYQISEDVEKKLANI